MASFVQSSEKTPSLLSGLSKFEREELTKERRAKLSKYELIRERAADKLKCAVFFCLPVVVVVLILLVLIGIYIVRPYQKAQELKATVCRVNRTIFLPNITGTCSHRTEDIRPCIKIFVQYYIDINQEQEGILMENEQALVHCDKCSFTFGGTSFLSKRNRCVWKPDLGEGLCLQKYLETYGMPFSPPYQCYYDPNNPTNVIRVKHISGGEVGYLTAIPVLILCIWLSAIAFLLLDRYKRRFLNKQILIKQKNGKHEVREDDYVFRAKTHSTSRATRVESAMIGVDGITNTSIDTTVVSEFGTLGSSDACDTITKRRRKKKLPCCRPHQEFDYLDEGMVLEDKPLSFDNLDQRSYSSSFVAIETASACNCSHLKHKNNQLNNSTNRNTFPALFHTNGQIFGPNPGQILRYLPESVV